MMKMTHARTTTLAAAMLALLAWTACGKATGVDLTGDGGAPPGPGSTSGNPSGNDSGLPEGCPAAAPTAGDPCPAVGLKCSYTSDMKPCGTITCGDMGTWEGGFNQIGCPLPPGLSCPTLAKPELQGSASPVTRTCSGDSDCASVTFETDCCGNTFAFGVNTMSVEAATVAAKTCSNSFPGCGCPEGPTVAETGMSDGGFAATIEAYCDLPTTTCRTRYR